MRWVLLFVAVFLISACGRKRKDLFLFEKSSLKPQFIRRLDTVKQVTAQVEDDGSILLRWVRPVIQENESETFVGYNVYRLRSWGIIPRQPLNKKPLKDEFFKDNHVLKNEKCYAISMIFTQKKISYEGPVSRIVSVNFS